VVDAANTRWIELIGRNGSLIGLTRTLLETTRLTDARHLSWVLKSAWPN
jgi:hypothetical protein